MPKAQPPLSEARTFSGRVIFRAESPAICAAGEGIARKAGASPVLGSKAASAISPRSLMPPSQVRYREPVGTRLLRSVTTPSFVPDPPSEASPLSKLLADALWRNDCGDLAGPKYGGSSLASFELSVLIITGNRHESGAGVANPIDGYACDLPTVVDVAGVVQIDASGNERVEVGHHAVFPDIRGAKRVGCVARMPHNLPLVVNATGECQRAPGKRAEVGDNALLPQPRMIGGVVGQERLTEHLTSVVDVQANAQEGPLQPADIGRRTVFPDDRMKATGVSDVGANPRTSSGLAVVIDRVAKSIRVAGERMELLDLALFRPPNDRLELKHLGRRAGCVPDAILRKPHDLAFVIHIFCLRVIAAGERGERRHHAVLPKEPETGSPIVEAKERETKAKSFP